MTTLIVLLLVGMVVGGTLMTAFIRRALYAALWFGFTLLGMGGLFVALGSPFVAAMQILIYVGGIMVLMVFIVMMSLPTSAVRGDRRLAKSLGALTIAGLFFAVMLPLILRTDFGPPVEHGAEAWGVEAIGAALLGRYNLVFEALSLVLVIAIIGAVMIAPEGATGMIGIHGYLILSLFLFCVGLFIVLERRGLVVLLIGIELMLNGASLNFMAFNYYCSPDPVVGQVFVLFIIGLTAAEIAIAFSIVLALYWSRDTSNVEQLTSLKR